MSMFAKSWLVAEATYNPKCLRVLVACTWTLLYTIRKKDAMIIGCVPVGVSGWTGFGLQG